MKKRILGVDPGTNQLGYAILEVAGTTLSIAELGVIKLGHLEHHHHKLKRIFEKLQALIEHYRPQQMAIEAPFFGKNVQSMLKLGRAQGVAMAAGLTRELSITEYSPKKVKLAVTGNGNASKEQVAAMLQQMLEVDLSGHALDATDALAVALCHHYQSKRGQLSGKRYADWSAFVKDHPDKLRK